MIKYNYEVSVNENRAKLNKDIFLFRGNRNIHYYFSIKGARFTFSKENEDLLESSNAIYAAVTVVKPNGVEVANAIAPVEDGLIHLKVTEDLIDEEVEVGDFDLVFDLFDDNEGAVTIPKIKGQFHVQERPCTTSIGTLSGNVNVVNQAVVDLAIATQENEQLIVVDDDGKYVKTTWVKGDKISIERLNKIEEGIEKNSTQYKDITNYSLEKKDDGKLYLKKGNEYVGSGIEFPTDVDLSKVTMNMSGQTLKLLNNGSQIATVEIPTNTVTNEQLSTAIQAKINDGSLGALTIEDFSITENKLAYSIDKNKRYLTDIYASTYSNIENNGTINLNANSKKSIAFKDYYNMDNILSDNADLAEKGQLYVQLEVNSPCSYMIFYKNNSTGEYNYVNANMNSTSLRLVVLPGFSFALSVYDERMEVPISELKTTLTCYVSYYPTTDIEKIDGECIKINPVNIIDTVIFGDNKIINNYLIPIDKGINTYYIKFKNSSSIITGKALDQSNVCGLTLYGEYLKPLGNISGNQYGSNNYMEYYMYNYNNEYNGDAVVRIILKDSALSTLKYIVFSKTALTINENVTVEVFANKLHDSIYQEKVKKYGLELNGDMQRKIKNYNTKYKNYKGMYERLEDGRPISFNMDGYSYPFNRGGSEKTTYYQGEKGDFYIYTDDDVKLLDNSQATKGCIVYFNGTYLKAEPNPFWIDGNEIFDEHYDVFIAGGGSGAIGTAFALKDLGYKVCMVEKLDSLGGTHANTGIISAIPSPVGSWYKEILSASIANKGITVANNYVTADNLDTMFKAGQVSLDANQVGKQTTINPYWYRDYLLDAFAGKIDVKLNTEVIDNKEINGKIIYATVRNTKTGIIKNIYADYFVDCTADCYLLRANKELGKDYYIGSDNKTLYNESAYSDGYVEDKYGINSYEVDYYQGNPVYNMLACDSRTTRFEDGSKYDDINGVDSRINGKYSIFGSYKHYEAKAVHQCLTIVSPDYYSALPQNWLIDYGYDYTYKHAEKYAKAHYKKCSISSSNSNSSFRGITPLLAIREGYRMKCDRMLKQSDIETRVTADNLISEHYVALSTWYADSHVPTNKTATFNASAVQNSWLNGVPYECLIPSCYKNALVACRGFGASHIGASAVRLVRTMMSLGYASGKAIQLCLENKLNDVRNVDIAQLQTNIGISDLLTEVNARITELSTS